MCLVCWMQSNNLRSQLGLAQLCVTQMTQGFALQQTPYSTQATKANIHQNHQSSCSISRLASQSGTWLSDWLWVPPKSQRWPWLPLWSHHPKTKRKRGQINQNSHLMQISLLNCVMNFHDVSLLGEWIDAQNCSSIFSSQWSSTKLWKLASRLTKSSLGFPSEVMVWSGRHGSRRKHWSNSCQRHPWIWWIWLDWYGSIMISAFLIFGDVNSPFSMCFWYSQVLLHCKKYQQMLSRGRCQSPSHDLGIYCNRTSRSSRVLHRVASFGTSWPEIFLPFSKVWVKAQSCLPSARQRQQCWDKSSEPPFGGKYANKMSPCMTWK